MTDQMISNIRNKKPYIHHITNYVTVGDCANVTLAIGASPIMADDEAEVGEIVAQCDALVINIGTLNQRSIGAMIKAGETANQKGIPVILDPVGNGASALRTGTVNRLIERIRFSVIRGNVSEIKMACLGTSGAKGVDAAESDRAATANISSIAAMAKRFSEDTGAVVAVTGEIDVVADKDRACMIRNGSPEMCRITGTGCMCTSLIGSFCGVSGDFFAAAACGVAVMGIAGEIAAHKMRQTQSGLGSMRMFMIDAIGNMTDEMLSGGEKSEII